MKLNNFAKVAMLLLAVAIAAFACMPKSYAASNSTNTTVTLNTTNTTTSTTSSSTSSSSSSTTTISTGQQVTVNVAPSNTATAGSTLTVSAQQQGLIFVNPTYAWSSSGCPNFVNPGNQSTFSYVSKSSGATTDCVFQVSVSDLIGDGGSGHSTTVVITSASSGGSPTITVSPTTQTVDSGQTITLSGTLTNSGSAPDTYQWYNTTSGTPVEITGATSSTFTETAGAANGAFSYDVVVTDSSQATGTSATASVTVSTGPTVSISQPSEAVEPGQIISFNATAGSPGSGGDNYEWYNLTGGSVVDTHQSGLTFLETANSSGVFIYNAVVTDSEHETGTSGPAYVTVLAKSGSPASTISQSTSTSQTTAPTTTTISSSASSTSTNTTTIKPKPTPPTPNDILLNSSFKITPPTPLVLYLTKANTTLYISTISPADANVLAVNITNSIIPFPGYNPLVVLNLSISAPVQFSSALQLQYPCTIPSTSLQIYQLEKSGWHEFTNYTIDAPACTIRVGIPSDPVIGLFDYNSPVGTIQTSPKAPPASPNIVSTNSVSTTTPANTIIINDPKPSYPIPFLPLTAEEIAAAIIVVVFIALFFYMAKPAD